MQDWLAARAKARPDATALIIGARQWSYAELHDAVTRYTARLAACDVRLGDRVGVLLPNGAAYVCLIHALARLGAVLVPLNTRLTATELAWQLDHTNCRLLIHDDLPPEQTERLSTTRRRVLHLDEFNAITPGQATDYSTGHVNLDAPFVVVFTSGTTGHPKGATLTYSNLFHSAMASAYRLGVLPGDRWLCVLPLYHVGGLSIVMRSCLYGTAIDLHPRFDTETVNHALLTQPVTLISLVPTMLYRLLEAKGDSSWTPTLRLVLLGGAAASPELVKRCEQDAVPIATTYGLSEASSQVATLLPDGVRRKPGSVGKPLLFTSVRVIDENGAAVPSGAYGEVVVGGATIMRGYYDNPAANARTLREHDGQIWLYTGDIGYLDDDGDLWIVQRRSDLIVSGGENVYPAEVEAVLKQHPAVKDACVVGIDDPEWGQRVAAAVVLQPGHYITTEALLTFSRGQLAGYKQPRLLRFYGELPQTASGKIQRAAVRDLLAADQ